jgi:hypothetical protein
MGMMWGRSSFMRIKMLEVRRECLCVLVVAVNALVSPRIATWYICFIIEYCTYHASRMRDAA